MAEASLTAASFTAESDSASFRMSSSSSTASSRAVWRVMRASESFSAAGAAASETSPCVGSASCPDTSPEALSTPSETVST